MKTIKQYCLSMARLLALIAGAFSGMHILVVTGRELRQGAGVTVSSVRFTQ